MSMPRLAAYLDVGVTSIYWYFKSKRELLDAMAEEALVSFYESMPALRGDAWEDVLREFFKNFYALLAVDDLKCDLIARRIGSLTYQETITSWPRAAELLAGLRDAGFPSSLAWHAFFTLSTYTRGFLLTERPAEDPAAAVPAAAQPSGVTVPEDFEFGITNIILGLRTLLPEDARDRDVA
ncbi:MULTISPECIES: TetR family transcriptional regulator [unclassified Frankia]|uniref:TetR family transcriptional regulator n=1 Tax=unclassified Frankia TaxID=2632575 RepID=UPI0021031C88|nr:MULTISPECIES: TetR family transcriptional regulator [unclassified Frankia]